MDAADRRRSPRFHTRFDALYGADRGEGAGKLVDLSYSGAHLEDTSAKPELGTQVRVYVFIQPVSPFELIGEVVRHTEKGFALAYSLEDPEIRRLIDDVAGIVAAAVG